MNLQHSWWTSVSLAAKWGVCSKALSLPTRAPCSCRWSRYKRHWQLFFSLEKSLNKKINLATRTWAFIILWQRCMSRTGTMHIKVIIICHVRRGVRELFGKIIPHRAKCHRKWTAPQESRSKLVCHSRHNEDPVLLLFQGILSASCRNTVWASASDVSLDIPRLEFGQEKHGGGNEVSDLALYEFLFEAWEGGVHNFQAASRTELPQLWIWTHGGQQCLWGQMKKIYIYKRNPLVSPSKELRNLLIFFIFGPTN